MTIDTWPAQLTLLFGAVIVLALLAKAALQRLGAPAMVGWLAIGMLLRSAHDRWGLMGADGLEVFAFLGEVGVAVLLFRVGFEMDLAGLRRQLRRASLVWTSDVLVSGGVGFAAAFWLLDLELLPSLFVAAALTATSVGVSLAVWQEEGALRSRIGEALVDVAELDDISAVLLLGLLLALVPALQRGDLAAALPRVAATAALFLLKAALFGALCLAFARWIERPVARFLQRVERGPDPLLSMTAIGLVIAAAAAFLGFSSAIGAFFAGLVFKREEAVFERDATFTTLYGMLVPFFFVGIGLAIPLAALGAALAAALALALAAALGKMLGAGLPAAALYGAAAGPLIGVSMVPRAEIALIVMQQGNAMGAVPAELFAAVVGVAALTSVAAPIAMRPLLRRAELAAPASRPATDTTTDSATDPATERRHAP